MKIEISSPAVDKFETEMNRRKSYESWDIIREKLNAAVEAVIVEHGPTWLATAELDAMRRRLAVFEKDVAVLRAGIAALEKGESSP